ncbi:glycosyltransferase family 10 domain-containing protein [Salinirubellus sp. GCM10025818]|uniref:glycosyltransferase family 10 domain-containing protein n=1 Tax=Salinirubellus TaxID=2162630 RepID=UPI0030CBAB88
MRDTLGRALGTYAAEGATELTRRVLQYLLRTAYFRVSDDTFRLHQQVRNKLFEEANLNVCRNGDAMAAHDENKRNVLVLTESPAVVEHEDWVDPNEQFYAEISFGNFLGLDNYRCPRALYAGFDGFVRLDTSREYGEKSATVSMIYSDKRTLPGHVFRHEIADAVADRVDLYGSGTGTYLEEKAVSLNPYMYQVVVENGKYPGYVSEKFYDCLKTLTVPIYWGGEEAVETLGFDTEGVLFFDTLEDLSTLLDEEVSPRTYDRLLPSLRRNREHLIDIRNGIRLDQYASETFLGFTFSPDVEGRNLHLEPS